MLRDKFSEALGVLIVVSLSLTLLVLVSFAMSHIELWAIGTVAGVDLPWTPARWLALTLLGVGLWLGYRTGNSSGS